MNEIKVTFIDFEADIYIGFNVKTLKWYYSRDQGKKWYKMRMK